MPPSKRTSVGTWLSHALRDICTTSLRACLRLSDRHRTSTLCTALRAAPDSGCCSVNCRSWVQGPNVQASPRHSGEDVSRGVAHLVVLCKLWPGDDINLCEVQAALPIRARQLHKEGRHGDALVSHGVREQHHPGPRVTAGGNHLLMEHLRHHRLAIGSRAIIRWGPGHRMAHCTPKRLITSIPWGRRAGA